MLDAAAIGKPNECYLGIYKIGIKSTVQDIYFFGTPFLEKYYTSFSMEPHVKDENSDHLLVAMGPACQTANLGDVVYNKNYEGFNANK